jgi:hypothetical protein
MRGVIWFFAKVNFRLDFLMLDEMEAERYDYSRVEWIMLGCFSSQVWETSENDIHFSLFSHKLEIHYHRLMAFYHAMLGWKSIMNSTDRAYLPAYDPKESNEFEQAVDDLEQWIAQKYCTLFFLHFGRAASVPYLCIFNDSTLT